MNNAMKQGGIHLAVLYTELTADHANAYEKAAIKAVKKRTFLCFLSLY